MKSGRKYLYIFLLLFTALHSKEVYFPKAKVTYNFYEQKKTYYSNDIKLDVTPVEPPTIKFYRYDSRGESFLLQRTSYKHQKIYIPLKNPTVSRRAKSLSSIKVKELRYISRYDAVFFEIKDIASNKDSNKIDSIDITLQNSDDIEVLKVYETSENSGVFRGYFQPTNYLQRDFDGYFYLKSGKEVSISLDRRLKTSLKISSRLRSLTNYSNQKIWLENLTQQRYVTSGSFLKSKIVVQNSFNYPVRSKFMVDLDSSMKYVDGSLKVDDNKTLVQSRSGGFSFILSIPANSRRVVTYVSNIDLITQKQLLVQNILYDGNSLEIKTKVQEDLHQNSSLIVGRVSMGSKGVKGAKLYLENGLTSTTDEKGFYHFEDVEVGEHVVKVVPESIESRFAITSCEQSINYAGSKTSVFVDTTASHIAKANFCLKYVGAKKTKKKKQKRKVAKKMPKYSKKSFTSKANKILWPPKEFIPAFRSVKLAFMHKANLKAKVFVNGKEVDKLAFDGFEISKEKDYKIEKYRGVSIAKGDNKLTIKLYDDKNLVQTLSQNIHFSSSPIRAEVVKELSNLSASSRENPIIAVRFYDEDGYKVRRGLTGKCSINSPYYFSRKNGEKYTIKEDGIAYLELMPTTTSGKVKLHFDFMSEEEVLSTWLKSSQKRWVVVGFAKGSIGYKTLKKGMKKVDQKYGFKDKKVSFFAKGKVSDEVLLTIAYNSAKKIDLSKLENSNLKKSYFVYTDKSEQSNQAPSSKKLYLKLERNNFYALFGDFKTGLTQTKLAKYDVSANGIKSEYDGDGFSYTFFATNSKGVHKKEELIPDGTSGRYILKYQDIIENSESITIMTRQKDSYDRVIKTQILTKDIDYNINYHDGYIYFKEPQFSKDAELNPKYIVVDYEVDSVKNKNLTAGVHITAKPTKDIKVGATYVRSDQGLKIDELKGIDVMMKLFKDVDLEVEGAVSKKDDIQKKANHQKLTYHKKDITLEAYHDYKESGFGIENQENLRDLDKDIKGVRTIYSINKQNDFIISHEDKKTISSGEKEAKNQIDLRHKGNGYLVDIGYKQLKSEDILDKKALLTLRKSFFNSKLTTTFTRVKSLGESILAPDETIYKVSYLLNSNIKLFAQRHISEQKGEKTIYNQSGVSATPWKGATIDYAVVDEKSPDSFSTYANYGMRQKVVVTKNLSVGLGYLEKKSLKNTSDKDNYKSYTLSAGYKKDGWQYNSKVEYKDAKKDMVDASLKIYSKENKDSAIALGIRGRADAIVKEAVASAAYAYRPKKGETVIVNRVDLKATLGDEIVEKKVVNNLYFSTKVSKKVTLNGQLGLKYLKATIDNMVFDNTVGLAGLDVSYDINPKMQINSQATMSFSLENKTYEYSAGSSVGYSPFRDTVVAIGYNVSGFDDEDFESDIYRNKGAFVNFKLKFDEFSLNERAKRAIR